MTTMRTVVMVGLILSAAVLAGCSHEVRLQLTNETARALPVTVSGPGIGIKDLGTLGPYRELKKELEFDKDRLPARVTLKAGKQERGFLVTEEGPEVFRFCVGAGGEIVQRGKGPLTREWTIDKTTPITDPKPVIE